MEFAIILPLLVFLTFGVIEFALLMNANSNVASAGRAGGRSAAIVSLDPQLEFKAADAAAAALNVSPSSVDGTPEICVGKYNPTSADPCGDFASTFPLVHTGTPGAPTWQISIPGYLPGDYPPTDTWPIGSRNYGCPNGAGVSTFDRVIVRVRIDHSLVVPGLFRPFFGGDDAPNVASASTFQLEPVPLTGCP